MSLRSILFLATIVLFNFSCSVSRKYKNQNLTPRWLQNTLRDYPGRSLGVIIYDPESKETLLEYNSEKYFVPASNIKIYTLYSALKNLGDSLVAFKYHIKNDTINILATADPTLLHPDFQESAVLNFLSKNDKKLITVNTSNFINESLGLGWAWDDYNDDYQAELSAFPIYGNIVRIKSENFKIGINPMFFKESFSFKPGKNSHIKRDISKNIFYYTENLPATFSQDIPFKTSQQLMIDMFADSLQKPVTISKDITINYDQTLKSIDSDTVYRRMMYLSDNMLAEQLILMVAGHLSDTLSTPIGIKQTLIRDFKDLPQAIKWVDGSGLSRYNLTTPLNTVKVLEKMYNEINHKRLFTLFPAGGINGTLKKYYGDEKEPYVYAKTGSLSGVYNQSGYVKTKTGKWLIFSIMNNNFLEPASAIGLETSKIVKIIRESY